MVKAITTTKEQIRFAVDPTTEKTWEEREKQSKHNKF